MINPSSAPKSPNPMPAGLGALTQMGPTPKGKSPSNMGQVMAMARKMSDMQLSDVLKGLSLAVPQFAAMTEAMGRKSLRNAMQGAEAQMQAKAPNLKDKMLAEEDVMPAMVAQPVMAAGGGLTSIPAPNMDSMDMAGGGIIAFAGGGESMAGFTTSEEQLLADEIRRRKLVEERGGRIREDGTVENAYANLYGTKPPSAPVVPSTDAQMNADQGRPGVAAPRPNAPPPGAAAPRPAGGSPVVDPFAGLNFDTSKYDEKYKALFGADPTFTKRDSPYYGMKYEGEDAGKVKEQGIGFGLMKAGQALLKNPTFAGGLGDAIGAFGDQGWLTAKEIKAAKKDERDYNFNMAKATELFEQGESERAIKIQTLAQAKQAKVAELGLSALKNEIEGLSAKDLAKYRKDSLEVQRMQANRPDSSVALLNALKDPANMAIYQQMNAVKKPDFISKEKALQEYNDKIAADPRFEKRFPTPQSYYNYVQQSSAANQPRFLGFE